MKLEKQDWADLHAEEWYELALKQDVASLEEFLRHLAEAPIPPQKAMVVSLRAIQAAIPRPLPEPSRICWCCGADRVETSLVPIKVDWYSSHKHRPVCVECLAALYGVVLKEAAKAISDLRWVENPERMGR